LILGQLSRACRSRDGVHRRYGSIGFSLPAQFVRDYASGVVGRLIHGRKRLFVPENRG
jgi:hypothetical protein